MKRQRKVMFLTCFKKNFRITIILIGIILGFETAESKNSHKIPFLAKIENTTQLIVDSKPYIILRGELVNSSFTSIEYMEPVWPKLKTMNLNTVLVPVYWELIEPVEGELHFDLYDVFIEKAIHHDFKLVILWFGSWKNSMSSHAPAWVKLNSQRFSRVKDNLDRRRQI